MCVCGGVDPTVKGAVPMLPPLSGVGGGGGWIKPQASSCRVSIPLAPVSPGAAREPWLQAVGARLLGSLETRVPGAGGHAPTLNSNLGGSLGAGGPRSPAPQPLHAWGGLAALLARSPRWVWLAGQPRPRAARPALALSLRLKKAITLASQELHLHPQQFPE